jgi:hypothetical protein
MTNRRPARWERVIGSVFNKAGLSVQRTNSIGKQLPVEATTQERDIIAAVEPYTMTSYTRIWSLLRAVNYIHAQNIPGAIVECGVWRGGSMMAAALQLRELDSTDRDLWLYDTYEGMTPPTDEDREAVTGVSAHSMLSSTAIGDGNNVWCLADERDVRTNMTSTGYPGDRLHFVKGDVAETLTQSRPESIALLRLDTDWYASTKAELELLYSRLAPGGICILDDYGHWEGARKAVDQYFQENPPRPLMMPIDYSGRIFMKPC